MSTTLRSLRCVAFAGIWLIAACDSSEDGDCLSVTPDEDYVLSGTAGSTNFTPGSKTYTARNACDSDIAFAVEEDVRWLDVDIGTAAGEQGILSGNGSVSVVVEVVYGDDNPQRLNQLAAGSYGEDVRFIDGTSDEEIVRSVDLTVNAP